MTSGPDFDSLRAAADKAYSIRRTYSAELRYGNIPFHQFVTLSDNSDLKTLGKIKTLTLLASFPGWTTQTAQHAFVSNGLPVNMTVDDCKRNPDYLEMVSAFMNSSASRWQQRIKAPEGWPWFGNIIDTLMEMEDTELPREIVQARYKLEKGGSHTAPPMITDVNDTDGSDDTDKKDPAELDYIDPLDALFGDDDNGEGDYDDDEFDPDSYQ